MIESRRAASATPSSRNRPSESGPRWTSVALIASSRPRSTEPREETIPQIPHTGAESRGALRDAQARAYRPAMDVGTHEQLVLLLLLAAVAGLLALVPTLRLPYPILLVLGGLAMGFVPGIPHITLQPQVVLVAILPPLLYSSAFFTSLRDLRQNIRPLSLLAV